VLPLLPPLLLLLPLRWKKLMPLRVVWTCSVEEEVEEIIKFIKCF
jgi:hypothetical protein